MQSLCTITSNVEVSPSIHLMWLEAPDVAATAQPGQFITVRCKDLTLRRPLSIHQVVVASETKQSQVALLFKVVGKGTLWLSQLQIGDKIDILGPLGKGFSIPSVTARCPECKRRNMPRQSRNLLLVAGGIGIAPLAFWAQRASSQHSLTLIHGASTAAQLYEQPLPPKVQFIPVTEDGTMGRKAMVTDILPDFLPWADQVYACGPIEMYKAMAKMSLRAKRSNLKIKKCQVSLEVRMGCGIGACYGCTINTKKGLKQVCRDGPIFELEDIIWEEVRV